MTIRVFIYVSAFLIACYGIASSQKSGFPPTRFTCQGRASGYYADVDTGCQVYHMCDGLGRQFSYTCPNTTLFQQRMLICDHWYMVNCSKSESDYDANLLIGQRDKPFVSEADMRMRTPRPDILSVPPNNNYYDGLKEAETKFPIHPDNNIVGIGDTLSSNNNGLDSAKHQYRPPTSWSTGTAYNRPTARPAKENQDKLTEAASSDPKPTFEPKPSTPKHVPPPSQDLVPPYTPTTTEEVFQIDMRMKDPVYEFIKRFDPNSPDPLKTAMTKTEIQDINDQLPTSQATSEEERSPRRNKDVSNHLNTVQSFTKGATEATKFDTVNIKPTIADSPTIRTPERDLLPPKKEYSQIATTTMGPPIYYEWKWAVPAFDLEPPKQNNETHNSTALKPEVNRSPFSDVTRPTPKEVDLATGNTEYNISSYFVPDYVFPLDMEHPGYENDNAQTSFQVQVSRPGRASYGENPNCPQCHPAYLTPGTCEPCIIKR